MTPMLGDPWSGPGERRDFDDYSSRATRSLGKDLTNPSYFAPAYYKYFARSIRPMLSRWNALATNCYTQLKNISGTNGLVPAWCSSNCTVRAAMALNYTDEQVYQYDSLAPLAHRPGPVRNGDANAKAYLDRVVDSSPTRSNEGLSRVEEMYTAAGVPYGVQGSQSPATTRCRS